MKPFTRLEHHRCKGERSEVQRTADKAKSFIQYSLNVVLLSSAVATSLFVEKEENHPALLVGGGESTKRNELLLLPFEELRVHVSSSDEAWKKAI